MTEHPDVSVLIVNWNTRAAVLACLDALPVGIDDDLRVQTVVVDNGSVDGSAEALATRPESRSSETTRTSASPLP